MIEAVLKHVYLDDGSVLRVLTLSPLSTNSRLDSIACWRRGSTFSFISHNIVYVTRLSFVVQINTGKYS